MRTRIKIHANKDTYYFIQVQISVVFLSIQKSPALPFERAECVSSLTLNCSFFQTIVQGRLNHCVWQNWEIHLFIFGSPLCASYLFFSLSLISNALMSGRKAVKVFHHKPFMLLLSFPTPFLSSIPPSLSLTPKHTYLWPLGRIRCYRLAVRYFQNYPQMFDLG